MGIFMDFLKHLIKIANSSCTLTEYSNKKMKNAFYWSGEWRELKKRIIERDCNECKVCALSGRVSLDNLIVHHIYPLEYYPEKRLVEDNLITVCIQCHNKIHGQSVKKWDDEWW